MEGKKYQKLFEIKDSIYTSCYCEENVYKLAEKFLSLNLDPKIHTAYAVFITNK